MIEIPALQNITAGTHPYHRHRHRAGIDAKKRFFAVQQFILLFLSQIMVAAG
jgi:hypothetical protein